MAQLLELAKTFGVPLALCAFFAYINYETQKNSMRRDAEREKSMTGRLRVIEDYQRGQMGIMIRDLTQVHEQTIEALKQNTVALGNVNTAIVFCSSDKTRWKGGDV